MPAPADVPGAVDQEGTGYALFLRIGADSGYVAAMMPTFFLGGLGFALAYGR